MADVANKCSSVSCSISKQINGIVGQELSKSTFLYLCEDNLFWKGDYDGLKELIKSNIKLSGKWLSTGGTKEFLHRDFMLKWHGRSNQIVVIKDNEENYLVNSLKHCSNVMDTNQDVNNEAYEEEGLEHMADVVEDENNGSCDSAMGEYYQLEINKILILISEMKQEKVKESQNAILRAAESEAQTKVLIEEQNKMAAEIRQLKSIVEDLESENKNIKMVLDMKQDEWIKVVEKKSTNNQNDQKSTISLQNSFEPLQHTVVDDEYTSFPVLVEVESDEETGIASGYTKVNNPNQKPNPKKTNKNCGNVTKNTQAPKSAKPTNQNEKKTTLVIGDSMVKNIDRKKIERAAGNASICHSYSGAKIKQIEEKFKNETDGKYDSVILHVGTNDLVYDDAEKVAKNMEDLIEEVKTHSKKIAVSSVVTRYDGRINSSKITHYNTLLENLCSKHNINFINNTNIGKSLLNGSNLHLNWMGDKALGSAFCSFLKPYRIRTPNTVSGSLNNNKDHFFHQTYAQPNKEWTSYLNYVREMMK